MPLLTETALHKDLKQVKQLAKKLAAPLKLASKHVISRLFNPYKILSEKKTQVVILLRVMYQSISWPGAVADQSLADCNLMVTTVQQQNVKLFI